MKKIFMILGGIFLVIILLIIGMGLFTWYKSSKYEETAVPYIQSTVPELSKWDPELARTYMVPKVLEEISDEDFAKIFKYLSKLGSLKKINEPKFAEISTGATFGDGKQTLVTYTIDAVYENGDATITIVLLDLGTAFQVYRFNVNSMALAE